MENLIGRKVKGFKFDGDNYYCGYDIQMDNYIGKVGYVYAFSEHGGYFSVQFESDYWCYPAELIEQHLID